MRDLAEHVMRHNQLNPWKLICFLGLLALVIGCSGDDRVATVHGTVTLDGAPVSDASVTFMPKEGGRPAFGITEADGTYTLTTFEDGDGAMVGNHVVTVTAVDEEVNTKVEAAVEEHGSLAEVMHPNRRSPKQTWRVPQVYSESETSGLEFEVERGESNQADFTLSSKSK